MNWTQLLQETIFPIFCVVAMGFFLYKAYNDITARNKEREEKYIEILGQNNALISACQATNAKFVEQLEIMQASMKSIESDVDDIKDYLDLNKRSTDH